MRTLQKHCVDELFGNDTPTYVLQLHITELCNLRCLHCYQNEYGAVMSAATFYAVLSQYLSFTSGKNLKRQINITGGEPLLHPEFFEFAAAVRRENIRLGILTNGTLIDPETAEKLAALKPVFVQISLDGTKEIHNKIRGKGNFEKSLYAIDLLKKNGVKVLVSFTAQKNNRHDLAKLAGVCRKHSVDKLWWDRVVTYSPQETAETALTTEEFSELLCDAVRVAKIDRFLHRKKVLFNCRSLQFAGDKSGGGYHCSAGHNLIVICADGSVMPCRRLPFVIGNINDNTLSDIIKSSDVMKELAGTPIPAECIKCRELARCLGGSKCVTYAQTGSFKSGDVNCPFAQQNKQE